MLVLTNTYAIPPGPSPGGGGKIPLPLSPTQKFRAEGLPAKIVSEVLPIILVLGGFLAVVVIVISGIQFVLSGGNPEGAAAAKNRLIYAIVGFIIIILAFAVLQIVNRLFLGNTGIV